MAISDLRNTIRRMEKREMQLIHLLQRAHSALDTPAGEALDAEAVKILGPNWRG